VLSARRLAESASWSLGVQSRVGWCPHGYRGGGLTMRSASEQQLSLAAQLRETLDMVPAYTWYAVPTGALTYVNARTADYLGLPKDHPLRFGIDIAAAWDSHIPLLHPDDHAETRRVWSHCLKTESPGEVSFRVRNVQGRYRWFVGRAEPLRASDGTLLFWIGVNLDVEERMQAEFYLSEARRLAQIGSWGFKSSGFDYWSPQLFEIHGLKPGDKPPSMREYMRLVHPEDRDFVAEAVRKMLSDHLEFDFTKRIVRPDGAIRHVRCVGSPAATVQGFLGTGIDVTEKEELTRALRKSEEMLRRLVDGIPGLTIAMTAEGEFEFANQPVRDYFGKTLEELNDWRNNNTIHPDDLGAAIEAWTCSLQIGRPYDHVHRFRRFDGAFRWFRARGLPARDSDGNCIRWYVLLTDIDESKRAEEKLKEQEKELRQILEIAPQMIAVFGANRERLYANSIALSYMGIGLEEWRRRSAGSELHPDDSERMKTAAERAIGTRAPYELELRVRKRDGTYRWFLARYNPVRDDEGQPTRWYVACTDIEDRKRNEEGLQRENAALREEINRASMFEEIVGSSGSLQKVLIQVSKVAITDSTVLLRGETGTGKELIARAIHKRSKRAARAFIGVNCGAIPTSLIASELFGHEKGAFTGAIRRRVGRFEAAHGGTIFLDEVGDLPPDIQIALLRVLQEREIERVGGDKPIALDVRVLAATHRDLEKLVSEGRFREDLFYRLNVVPISVPALRERPADIPVLVEYFIARIGKKLGKKFRTTEEDTLKALQAYEWPGNVRELQNVIERAVILSDSDRFAVDEAWLKQDRYGVSRPSVALSSMLLAHEKEEIEAALAKSQGRVSGPTGAAAKLGMPISTLDSKIRRLGIDKYRFKSGIS
jgi:formate hydrogenlyase transcriptional activator